MMLTVSLNKLLLDRKFSIETKHISYEIIWWYHMVCYVVLSSRVDNTPPLPSYQF